MPTNQVCAALKALPGVKVLHSTVATPSNTDKMATPVPIKSATPRVGLRKTFDDTVVAAALALNTLAVVIALTADSGKAAVLANEEVQKNLIDQSSNSVCALLIGGEILHDTVVTSVEETAAKESSTLQDENTVANIEIRAPLT